MISNYDDDENQSDVTRSQRDLHRKKRRKLDDAATSTSSRRNNQLNNNHHVRWRTSAEQQTYSSKLISALRQVRSRTPTLAPISGSRAVREAADKALAVAARGRTRWSRAILTNRIKLRLKNHKKVKVRAKVPPPPVQPISADCSRPPIEKRVKVLGRLVPGCRKLSFPNLLEEATDYIAALQMQVRTMAALAELLSGSSPAASSMDIEPANNNSSNINDGDNPVH